MFEHGRPVASGVARRLQLRGQSRLGRLMPTPDPCSLFTRPRLAWPGSITADRADARWSGQATFRLAARSQRHCHWVLVLSGQRGQPATLSPRRAGRPAILRPQGHPYPDPGTGAWAEPDPTPPNMLRPAMTGGNRLSQAMESAFPQRPSAVTAIRGTKAASPAIRPLRSRALPSLRWPPGTREGLP